MSKIIVTGGCGFIGSNLVDVLCESTDNQVVVIDNLITGKKENSNEKAFYIYDDLMKVFKSGEHTEQLKDASVIFHLAALARIQPSFKAPEETFNNNVNGTLLVCEFARKNNIKVVYAGSSSFYAGPHLNPYSFTKWLGEETCLLYNNIYNLDVNIARFFNVYGPRHLKTGPYATVVGIFEEQYAQKKPLTITGDGHQRRDFTHVKDICMGLISMSKIDGNGEIYNFGTGKNFSINELAKMFDTAKTEYIPKRPGEAKTTLADISLAALKLGYGPSGDLQEYVLKYCKEINKELKRETTK